MSHYQILLENERVVSVSSDSPHGAIKEAFERGMLYYTRRGEMCTVIVTDMETYLAFEIKVCVP